MGDDFLYFYLGASILVAILWLVFRERPGGSYPGDNEPSYSEAVFVGLTWPLWAIGFTILIIMLTIKMRFEP